MYTDPNRKVFMPDFQADNRLPQWQPGMSGDDSEGQNAGAIGSAFKKRFMDGGGAEAPDGTLPYEGNGMPVDVGTGMAGAAPKPAAGVGGGGGMFKSLG